MAQKYTAENLGQLEIGKQGDLALAIGDNATSASLFFSVRDFLPLFTQNILEIEDAEGNRSNNSTTVIGDNQYPFSFSCVTDIEKLGIWLYLATGEVDSTQDGATGAYEHVYTMLNNVILPKFTLFFNFGGEGYLRRLGCRIISLSVSITDSEAAITVNGLSTGEDQEPNSTTNVSSLVITDIEFQSGSNRGSVMRYSFSGAPDFSGVKNGDVLAIPTTVTGIANDENKGNFIVLSADNTGKTIDVINNEIFDNSFDELAITSVGDVEVKIVVLPVYPPIAPILLRRHACVRDAVNTAGLDAADDDGLMNLTFEINHNSDALYEKSKSPDPEEIIAHNITIAANHTQILDGARALKARRFRNNAVGYEQRAYRYRLEDTDKLLGTSTTYSPLFAMEVSQAKAMPARSGTGNDSRMYEWTLHTSDQQSAKIVLRNETSNYI